MVEELSLQRTLVPAFPLHLAGAGEHSKFKMARVRVKPCRNCTKWLVQHRTGLLGAIRDCTREDIFPLSTPPQRLVPEVLSRSFAPGPQSCHMPLQLTLGSVTCYSIASSMAFFFILSFLIEE